ncbi:MAG TPA: phosphatidate cytidylyltransferase [Bacteroidetes bacterium]|nr:phosphatidate cytidylyltransferase [Bacteroidota bacterium]
MGNQLALMFIFMTGIICLLVFNEMVYRRLDLKGEITRKFAHFTATLSTIVFPYLFEDHWYVLAMAVFFFIILFISRNGTQLKSIHDIDRKSVGSYVLPAAIYLTFLVSLLLENKFLFILPMLILAICDPMAGVLGLNLKKNNYHIRINGIRLEKTILGTLSFLVSSFLISIVALYFHRLAIDLKTFWLALLIGFSSTLAELLSTKGFDNLLIPLSVILILIIFL